MREYFPRLVGNDATKMRIGRAIEEGRAPHAFLIGGPSGSGKNVLATEIAAAINCERRQEAEEYGGGLLGGLGDMDDFGHSLPCGCCNTCKRIYSGSFTDVKLLKKRKDKASLETELVKDFREDMFLSATESDYKVYIIDDAECMRPEGQNALLKVLEEPPTGVFIILLARECDRILTTIKSRTQYIAMSRFSDSQIEDFLLERSEEGQALYRSDREKFRAAVMSSDGRLGLAMRLVDPKEAAENEESRKEALAVIEAASGRGGFAAIYSAVKALPEKRAELSAALEEIISALRDLMVIKQAPNAPLVFFSDRGTAESYAESIDARRLLMLYSALCEALEQCQKNANVGGLLTSLMAKIRYGA